MLLASGLRWLMWMVIIAALTVAGAAQLPSLHKAAGEGRTDDVKSLLSKGADVNARDAGTGSTPLHVAAAFNQTEVVKLLLAAGANVNVRAAAQATNDVTPLMWAAQTPRSAILGLLLDKGADVGGQDSDGRTALFYALGAADIQNITALLEHRANPNTRIKAGGMTPLITAVFIGPAAEAIIKVLFQHGADIKAKTLDEGNSALISAAYVGRSDLVELLLSSGASVNDTNLSGSTALMDAAMGLGVATMARSDSGVPEPQDRSRVAASTQLYVDTIRVLLKHGADLNLKNKAGATALAAAEFTTSNFPGRDVIVQLLKSAGAKAGPNAVIAGAARANLDEALGVAAAGPGTLADLMNLIKQGANVNSAASTGETPLMWAVENGNPAKVSFLLSQHANVNAKDMLGETALMKAVSEGRADLVQTLIAAGGSVNAKDNENGTALMIAAAHGDTAIVKILLAKKADVNAKDSNDRTALGMAQEEQHKEIVDLLKRAGAK
jgi:uncharacterized protein